jgi:hypothetical protein
MLHPFIIEQIRRREEEQRKQRDKQQPRVEVPLDVYRPAHPAREPCEEEEDPENGVTILDLG